MGEEKGSFGIPNYVHMHCWEAIARKPRIGILWSKISGVQNISKTNKFYDKTSKIWLPFWANIFLLSIRTKENKRCPSRLGPCLWECSVIDALESMPGASDLFPIVPMSLLTLRKLFLHLVITTRPVLQKFTFMKLFLIFLPCFQNDCWITRVVEIS